MGLVFQGPIEPKSGEGHRTSILCGIVLMHMERFHIRAASLARVPGVHHKNLMKRLREGSVPIYELNTLMDHLQINSVNAYLCSEVFGKPEAYFDGLCLFMTELVPALARHLGEAAPALSGDFAPLKTALCSQLARRLTQDVIDHHQRLAQANKSAFE